MAHKKKHFRKIVRDRYQFSINLPVVFIKDLELEDSMTEIKIENNTIIIRKIGGPDKTSTQSEEKKKPYDYGDEVY